ncbi:Histone chaperone asf1b [Blyttiomyces sp. JEL0837]|nr:Histone chaperone asf1b [Blyttiomyces sp. JEL0837]
MAMVSLQDVKILDNPSGFFQPFSFEITFEVVAPLQDDLEFKVIYVGSAESEKYDQVLESVMVGPVPVGISRFVLQADPPRPDSLPKNDDILDVTVVLLTCSYKEKEFIRVGYYVSTDYVDEALKENPPPEIQFDKLAKGSAKRIVESNAKIIKTHTYIHAGVTIFNILFRVLIFWSSFTFWIGFRYILCHLALILIFRQLVALAAVSMSSDGIDDAGVDLTKSGIQEYLFDVVYVLWFVMVGTCFFDWVWYILWAIPVFAGYKLFMMVKPFLFGSGQKSEPDVSKKPAPKQKTKTKIVRS